jgi:hypothetical protein
METTIDRQTTVIRAKAIVRSLHQSFGLLEQLFPCDAHSAVLLEAATDELFDIVGDIDCGVEGRQRVIDGANQ